MTTTDNGKQPVGLAQRLLGLPRYAKRTLLVASDFAILAAIIWTAMSFRYNDAPYIPDTWLEGLLVIAAPLMTIATFAWFELYRLVTRFVGYRGTLRILACCGLAMTVWALVVFMTGQNGIPRTVILAYGIMSFVGITASRQIAGMILRGAGIPIPKLPVDLRKKSILIYGAGQTGSHLLKALAKTPDYQAVGFIDNEKSMWGQYVGGVKVYRPEKIESLIERRDVEEIILAIPQSKRGERRQIHASLEHFPVTVKILPDIGEIASGQVGITDARPIDVHDLLGRDPVPPNKDLLARSIENKSILVTGAGGSVGSELVRQILKQNPARIVLLDVTEVALYQIELEISEAIKARPEGTAEPDLVAVLGSILDDDVIRHTIKTYDVQTIYHAAAYKHVPLVEQNAFVGLANNTFGCAVVADAARDLGVERVVLVSTDKAVRPTNVMGASKRISELILQAHAATGDSQTIFTMVRFGNVLDSSGSVVRLFRNQIQAGGPVTVTHPEVIRYFMSIPEAAELVIQAGAMATGGEVFVLDMGEPVRIDSLARLMIRLGGFEPKDADNPDGDIEIVYTGLRPGEKLYEELLIGANTRGTEHQRIMRSDEPHLSVADLNEELEALHRAIEQRDIEGVQEVLQRTVEGYTPRTPTPPSESTASSTWAPTTRTLH